MNNLTGETKVYTVIFSAGETTVSFDVEIIDDDWIENDEIIQFMILQDLLPNGVNIGVPNMATVIIIDDAGNGQSILLWCNNYILQFNHTTIYVYACK